TGLIMRRLRSVARQTICGTNVRPLVRIGQGAKIMDPSDVEILQAPEHLRSFVRRYMYANRRLNATLVIRPKPTGYTYFANCFAGPSSYFAVVDGLTFPQTSRWHLPGQIVHHDIAVHHPDTHQLLYCELSATGLHRLFGAPGVRTIGRLASL